MENSNTVNAKIVYKDIDSNSNVASHEITGPINSPVQLERSKQYVPDGYQFKGYGHFNRYLRNHDVDVVYIKRNHTAAKGTVVVNYVTADSQMINVSKFSNRIGSPFNTNKCKVAIPKNYRFDRILIGSNIKTYQAKPQIMMVQVHRIRYATVVIKYLNNGRQVGQAQSKGVVNSKFDISEYIRRVPNGYRFVKVEGQVGKTFQHNRIVNIDVVKRRKTRPQANPNHQNRPIKPNLKLSKKLSKPEQIGEILMKLASSLHSLGLTISKSHKL